MAKSNVTKYALSMALKELMADTAFNKISVADICSKCSINRKSFYYHFRDKYDLANQTLNMDFPTIDVPCPEPMNWEIIKTLCRYLYENRAYYRKLLEWDGQNSFSEYLRNTLRNFFKYSTDKNTGFRAIFLADAVFCSIKDWLTDKKVSLPETFYAQLISCVRMDK